VATDALVAALTAGTLHGAALDVMEEEPPTAGSPLLGRPEVILGSHNASNTLQASARVHVMAIENLTRELGVTVAP
jgi:D-3-phosphoglycerate dehydrogenase